MIHPTIQASKSHHIGMTHTPQCDSFAYRSVARLRLVVMGYGAPQTAAGNEEFV